MSDLSKAQALEMYDVCRRFMSMTIEEYDAKMKCFEDSAFIADPIAPQASGVQRKRVWQSRHTKKLNRMKP